MPRPDAVTTPAATSYVPREMHQPRGKRPWCANCDTDLHLVVEFPGITGRKAGSIAVAVHCSQCSISRVLDTTLDHVAALPSRLYPAPPSEAKTGAAEDAAGAAEGTAAGIRALAAG